MTGEECYEKKCFIETVIKSLVDIGIKVKKLSSKDVFKEFFEGVIIIDDVLDPVAYETAKSLLPNQFILIHCLCFEQTRIGLMIKKDDCLSESAKRAISDQEEADCCWNYFLSEATLVLATAGDISKIIELIMPSLGRSFREK